MPKEIPDKMGIKFVSLPEEKEREKDEQLLALLLMSLSEDKQDEIRKYLGNDYFMTKLRKYNKIINIYNNNGKTIDVSKNPGATLSAISFL